MVDECSNCDYFRERLYGEKEVYECRVVEPANQGQKAQWPEVLATDWCGEYDPLGWNDPASIIIQGVTLNTTTKTKVIEVTIPGAVLWIINANITNTSTTKNHLVKFFDGNTTNMIGALAISPNQSVDSHPELRASTGEVWAQLDTSDGSDIYVYLQGKQGRLQAVHAEA